MADGDPGRAGRYHATSVAGEVAIARLLTQDPLPNRLEIAANVNAAADNEERFSNGFLMFDYVDKRNFKFVGGFFSAGNWRMGRVVNGQWINEIVVADDIAAGEDHRIQLLLDGSEATLIGNGRTMQPSTSSSRSRMVRLAWDCAIPLHRLMT